MACTRPRSKASCAGTMRPVRITSLAKPSDVVRASRWVPPQPGMIPRFTSGWPNIAFSEQSRMSHASAISQPPPSA